MAGIKVKLRPIYNHPWGLLVTGLRRYRLRRESDEYEHHECEHDDRRSVLQMQASGEDYIWKSFLGVHLGYLLAAFHRKDGLVRTGRREGRTDMAEGPDPVRPKFW
jgi:hypothetical protein